jgi:hypothetical protein
MVGRRSGSLATTSLRDQTVSHQRPAGSLTRGRQRSPDNVSSTRTLPPDASRPYKVQSRSSWFVSRTRNAPCLIMAIACRKSSSFANVLSTSTSVAFASERKARSQSLGSGILRCAPHRVCLEADLAVHVALALAADKGSAAYLSDNVNPPATAWEVIRRSLLPVAGPAADAIRRLESYGAGPRRHSHCLGNERRQIAGYVVTPRCRQYWH